MSRPARFARRLVVLAGRPEAALFCLVLGAYAYFYQAGGWNQNVRFALVRAQVEDRSAVIDRFAHASGDLSCRGPDGPCKRADPARGQHYYCDKAPGASWLAAPAYAAWWLATGKPGADGPRPPEPVLDAGAYVSTVWAVGVPSALGVVALLVLLGALGAAPAARAAVALAYGLGTLAFPYATLFYGHQLAAALLLIGFALLVDGRRRSRLGPRRLALVGLVLGFAVVVEYPSALAVAVICVYAAAFVRPLTHLAWLVAGGAVCAAVLAAYHTMVFGGPLTLPYEFSTQVHRHINFMGLGMPSGEALASILFTSYRGLFYSAPWLAAGLVGAVVLVRRGCRAEVAVCGAVFVLFVWLNASLVDWQGGWAMGPRYLIGGIPFLAVLAVGVFPTSSRPRWRWVGVAALAPAAVFSFYMMLVGTAVKPEVPTHIREPFADYLLPAFRRGDLAISTQGIDTRGYPRSGPRRAWNWGQRLGLEGRASLVPLALWLAGTGAWLGWALRREPFAASELPDRAQ